MHARSLTLAAALAAALFVGVPAARETPSHLGCAGKDVHFRAADGTKLVALRWGAGTTAVVLAHEDQGSLCQWESFSKQLARRGYTAIAFDFRGFGESQYRTGRAEKRYAGDVTAAVKLARSLGAKRVVVAGASMGGWASLVAAASARPAVAGAISVSTPADYLGNVDPFVARLRMPLLFAAAKDDGSAAADARRMYAEAPSRAKVLRIVRGSAHGVALVASSAEVRGAIFRSLEAVVEARS